MINKAKKIIVKILYKPYFTLLFCFFFLFINLILDSTLFRIFHLNQNLRVIQNRIEHIEKQNKNIEDKIKKAHDPDFVEKEIRQRLDYTNEGDLIFIFPDSI